MADFPTYSFGENNVEVRFREQRMPESVCRRCYGLPRGVYVGYAPRVQSGSLVLTLAIDQRVGFSSLKVGSQSLPVQVDIFTKEAVTLNFTGHTQFPVYVIARADFSRDTHTQGRILTRAATATGPQEINICKVDKPGADLTVDATVPDSRNLPVAYDGQAFGYMLPGAAEDIIFAQTVTAEVIRARYSLATPDPLPPTPPPVGQLLADRLALDLAADYLAAQLGLRNNALVGNAKIAPASASSINVSGSFASTSREFEPKQNIGTGGSESTEGAITAPTDTVRNVCFLIDEVTGHRVIDANLHPVYGRLATTSGALTGTLSFENAQTTVQGAGTLFVTELQDGDIIIGTDGNRYEVASRTSQTELELSVAYLGADASSSSSFIRLTLSFYSRATGSEVAHALAAPTNIRFFFGAWNRADRSVFDALAFMHKVGERPVLGEATDALAGRIRLAIANAKAGAIYTINSNQAAIGSNFHTLNFSADNAAITPAGTGVANITVPGDQGDPGPGAIVGPKGPDGPAGMGLSACSPFELSSQYGPGGSHTVTVDFSTATPPLGGDLAHIVGGIAMYKAAGWSWGEHWKITNISKTGPLLARIDFDLDTAQAVTKVFLGASV